LDKASFLDEKQSDQSFNHHLHSNPSVSNLSDIHNKKEKRV